MKLCQRKNLCSLSFFHLDTGRLDREATDQKKKEIVEERKQKQYEDQVETWRKETDIKVDKKEWKKVDFEDQGVNVKQTTTDSEK